MDLQKWKENARESQQNYSNLLNDRVWEQFDVNNERQLLWDKIAFVVCGCKEEYNSDEKNIVEELIEKCIKYGKKDNNTYVAFLFVCAYNDNHDIQVPIIRVMKDDGKVSANSFFIDHVGRVYQSWSDLLKENILDQWWLCVPKNGIYSCTEEVEIEFYDQSNRGKVLETVDTVSTASNIVTSVAMFAGAMLTPLAPPFGLTLITASAIAGVPGAVYGTGREISKLVDRGQHDQSISLANSEARSSWISTVAGVLSFANVGSVRLLTKSAAGGNIVRAGVRTFCTSLNISTITVNGLGILNSVVEIASKKQEDITKLDILQLTTSIFFFTNSLVTFKTANQIVKDAQKATTDSMRNNLSKDEAKQNFDNLLRNTKKRSGKMHGSADFIRAVKRIDNEQEFFQAIGVDASAKVKFNRAGLADINNELIIHPNAFMQISGTQRKEIIDCSTALLQKKISVETFNEKVKKITQKNRIVFENQRKTAYSNICELFNVKKLESIDINGRKIFENIKPHEIDRLDSVFKGAGKSYNKKYLDVGIEFGKTMDCQNVTEFCAAFEYITRHMDTKVKAYRQDNPNPQRTGDLKVADFYVDKVSTEFKSPNEISKLKVQFDKLQVECGKANDKGSPKFDNTMAAANHYDKHKHFPTLDPNNPLSVERYFEIASEMCKQNVTPENSKITQDGSSVCITYKDPMNGAVAIRYDTLADGKSVIATLFHNDKVHETGIVSNNSD